MEREFNNIRPGTGLAATGALCGAAAWLAYFTVETWFLVIIPWLTRPGYDYMPVHWGLTLILLVLYPAVGAVAGGVMGLAYAKLRGDGALDRAASIGSLATFTVIAGYLINLLTYLRLWQPSVLLVLLLSVVLVVALLFTARPGERPGRGSIAASPFTAAALLVGVMWILKDSPAEAAGLPLKAAITAGYVLAVVLICGALRVVSRGSSWTRSGALAAYLAAAAATMVISLFPGQAPLIDHSTRAGASVTPKGPNVVLITLDTVRADHLSLYGYERETSPNLEAFSKKATLYVNAFANSDMTLSTHASIFTGLFPRQHGAHLDPWNELPGGRPLAVGFVTLTEVLRDSGYDTFGVVANHAYLRHTYKLNQGFSYYSQSAEAPLLTNTRPYFVSKGVRQILSRFFSSPYHDPTFLDAAEINSEVFSILESAGGDGPPFFLFINYMDAHEPYLPPPPFDALYPGRDEDFTTRDYRALEREVMLLKREISDRERDHMVSQYDGELTYLDSEIGRLIEKLKGLGLYDDAIIIITSDHGEAFGERHFIGHGVSAYQEQLHVPLVIKYPGQRDGRVFTGPVYSVDLMPTVLEVVGLNAPAVLMGKSLAGAGPGDRGHGISESFPAAWIRAGHPRFDRVERAVFSWPYKLISSTNGKRELYDLSKDPDEAVNLHTFNNPVSAGLSESLTEWLAVVPEASEKSEKLSSDAVERLKALGYVQ